MLGANEAGDGNAQMELPDMGAQLPFYRGDEVAIRNNFPIGFLNL